MKKTFKIILYIVAVLLVIALIYFTIPFIRLLMTDEGREVLNEKISSYGKLAPFVFVCIEILQIVAAFIPGAPIEIMSGVLFGGVWGVIWCIVGIYIGTAIVFFMVRKFGRPLVDKLFPKNRLDTIKILNDEEKLTLTIFILFIIPGTPKDFLTYIAGLTKINPFKFFIIAAAARTPSMTCSVLMGANLGQGRYVASIILFCIILVLGIGGYFVKNKFLKNKGISFLKHKK
jgi:uncharacterized membrane protein YdjX (TVP38/TMEM64 family)